MIKGIVGYGYYDEFVVFIIENLVCEYEFIDVLVVVVSF